MKYKLLLLAAIVLCLCSVPVSAAEKACGSITELKQTLLEAVQKGETEIDLACPAVGTPSASDLTSELFGKFGQMSYGKNVLMNGIQTFNGNDYTSGDKRHYTFLFKYFYSAENNDAVQKQLTQWIHENITDDMSETVKSALVTEYIAENYQYCSISQNANAVTTVRYKQANAYGIADLAARMFTMAGLHNQIITGVIPGIYSSWDKTQPVTVDLLEQLYKSNTNQRTDALMAWNLVQVDGQWYHVNLSLFLLPEKTNVKRYEEELFNSDEVFDDSDGWIKSEYPAANSVLWIGSSKDKQFLRAYFDASLYKYPMAQTQQDVEQDCRDALKNGDSVVRVISKGDMPMPDFFGVTSEDGTSGMYSYEPLKYGGAFWETRFRKQNLTLTPNHPKVAYPLNQVPNTIQVERGQKFDKSMLTANVTSTAKEPEMMILSPSGFREEGGKFTALKSGFGIVALIGDDYSKIVKVTVSEPKLQIVLNDNILTNAEPIVKDGHTLVPLRTLLESMGASVNYDSTTRMITVVRGDKQIQMKPGSSAATVNGNNVTLDTPVVVIQGRTYIPARFVAESLGATVNWDELSNKVLIKM